MCQRSAGQSSPLSHLKLADAPVPGSPIPIETIGIELYTPLPDGVAVGGRFALNRSEFPGCGKSM
jgi:hypothetical protein